MKTLIFTLLLVFGAGTAFAQLEWTDTSPELWGPSDREEWKAHGYFKNTSAEKLYCVLHELNRNFKTGDTAYICWGGTCFTEDDPQRRYDTDSLIADETNANFYMYFYPGDEYGVRTICFGISNNEGNDTLKTCFTFNVTPAGVSQSVEATTFALTPNPASESVRMLHGCAGSRVTVYDLTGRALLTTTAEEVDVRSLTPGVYVCAVEVEGQRVATQRLIVAR